MKTVRILISSPGDVEEERNRARQVILTLQRRYTERFRLVPVLWEDLPLQVDVSFQRGIDLVLSSDQGIDISVFILWSRLGSPLGPKLMKQDGSPYRSGTERELDLMLQARTASDGKRPDILAYVRQDETSFRKILGNASMENREMERMLEQWRLKDEFLLEYFRDSASGANEKAYHTFTEPVVFATRLKQHLQQLLDKLLACERHLGAVWDQEPFRGLQAFEFEHSRIFFGREKAIADILVAPREQDREGCAFMLIVGASGSGKSSLARAGVIPALYDEATEVNGVIWRHAVMTPGTHADDLMAALAGALAEAIPALKEQDTSLRDLAKALARDPETASSLVIKTGLNPVGQEKPQRLLLLVDQLEELFTSSAQPDALHAFFAALDALARSGLVWVLATVRGDFYNFCQKQELLMKMKGSRGQYDLLPPSVAELHAIITGPIALAGLLFERDETRKESLGDRILKDASEHQETLPLLEYLLSEIYQRRTPDGVLTWQAYESLGGVEGALGSQAENVFTRLPSDAQASLGEVLHDLVSVGEENENTVAAKRAEMAAVTNTEAKRTLVDALLKARLLAADRDTQRNVPIVRVSHEALLRCWPRVVDWISENRQFLRGRKNIEQFRGRWVTEGQLDDFLLPPGKPLVDGEDLLRRYGHWLDASLKDYISRSTIAMRSKDRKRVRRLQIVTATFAILVVVAGLLSIIAQHQKKLAEQSERAALKEAVRSKEVLKFLEGILGGDDPAFARGMDTELIRALLKRAADRIQVDLRNQPEIEVELRNIIGNLYRQVGDYAGAEEMHRAALTVVKRLGGSNELLQAQAGQGLARVLAAEGKNAEAEPYYRQALALQKSAPGSNDVAIAQTLNDLAGCLNEESNRTEAMQMFQESLAMRRRVLGETNMDVAMSMENIAVILEQTGKLSEAEVMQRKVLALQKSLVDSNNPAVARTLNNLGVVLYEEKNYTNALDLFREELGIRRRLYVNSHPDVAEALDNYGSALMMTGDFAQAEKFLLEGWSITKPPHVVKPGIPLDILSSLVQLYQTWSTNDPAKSSAVVSWKAERKTFRQSLTKQQPKSPSH